ncbi:MAG: hypothetical protein GF411_01070 [Candidatus Lokiarchaeota archaeon]|nr:hypothetical protein [Candidatus Lokiarchaeota archaeon]
MKHSNPTVLKEDLKTGFRYAVKNIISFILGMIGVLIVTGIMMLLVAILIFIPLILLVGIPGLSQFFQAFGAIMEQSFNPAAISLIVLLVIPFISPVFVAVGALFGMAREIVESEGTSVQGVFTWYRSRFLPLAAAGIIMFGIIFGPIGLLFGIGWITLGNTIIGLPSAIIVAVSTAWIMISLGLTSMIFPGIIDGLPVLEAVKNSFELGTKYFDRVFSTILSYIGIIGIMTSPTVLIPFSMVDSLPNTMPGPIVGIMAGLGIFTFVGFFVILFVVIPALAISTTKVYMILTSNGISEPEGNDDFDVSIVGGV